MWPLLIIGGLVVSFFAFTHKAASPKPATKKGAFSPALSDTDFGNAPAFVMVPLPGTNDSEVSITNAFFDAGLSIPTLTEDQAKWADVPGEGIARFGGKPVALKRIQLGSTMNQQAVIAIRMVNKDATTGWIVIVSPPPTSTFSIKGYGIAVSGPAGNM